MKLSVKAYLEYYHEFIAGKHAACKWIVPRFGLVVPTRTHSAVTLSRIDKQPWNINSSVLDDDLSVTDGAVLILVYIHQCKIIKLQT